MLTADPRATGMTTTASPHLALVSAAGRPPRLLIVGLTAGLMLLASWVWASPALAHTRLVQSSPPEGAVLQAPPQQVRLTFTDEIDPAFAQITVYDPSGEPVLTSDPRDIAPAGAPTTLIVDVESDLIPGRYELSYLVTSADGHPVSDAITFTVAAAFADPAIEPAAAPPADVAGVSSSELSSVDDSVPAWIWILGACSLVAAVVAAILLRAPALR
jgi:copper resistance protein C